MSKSVLSLLAILCFGSVHADEPAWVLLFEEQEAGVESYVTRFIVTAHYLRIDEGEHSTDFVLFDRKTSTIYSTNMEERRILVVRAGKMQFKMPSAIVNKTVRGDDKPPSISGKTVVHYRLYSGGKECYSLYAARGLLPEVVMALKAYRRVLASEHGQMLRFAPVAQPLCDVVNNIYAPTRHLDLGFPVLLHEYNGHVRRLVDYRSMMASPKLFELPAGHTHFSPTTMRTQPQSGVSRP